MAGVTSSRLFSDNFDEKCQLKNAELATTCQAGELSGSGAAIAIASGVTRPTRTTKAREHTNWLKLFVSTRLGNSNIDVEVTDIKRNIRDCMYLIHKAHGDLSLFPG